MIFENQNTNIYFFFNSNYNLTFEKHEIGGKKFYLGRSKTVSFQKDISEVLHRNLYAIDEYYHSNKESKIISIWKVNYIEQEDSTTIEYKTRLKIIGLIDNKTYSKTNSFEYECYLEIENYTYSNNTYIEEYNSTFIEDETYLIKKELRKVITKND